MDSTEKPWVKINSETYLECIVGNAAGLERLKGIIDSAIDNEGCDVEPQIKADFKVVVCTKEGFSETESVSLPIWQSILFYVVLGVWLGVLPITAIVLLVKFWL